MTDALVAFLRARLDDDEKVALAADPELSHVFTRIATFDPEMAADERHIMRQDPARTLREVEAKRRILRAHAKWCEGRCEAKYPEGGFDAAHYWSIKALAAVYADHPDYLQEWRP
ncbi:DUF6221 family protein [Streptomyces rhizosphaericola]|uniref:DUF6221 family protein n=1 Tax=Streptomyces rhizosphaericola TaxID=2564098 RepID=UPI003694678B